MTAAKAVMVCGTTSSAGKSFLATALCRWYAQRGLRVAPFKSQNMSNNARVVADGEMGSAQYFQALAARAEPHVRMNPVLLKPERDTHSQVILLGKRDESLTRMPWRERSAAWWPVAQRCLAELMAEHDVVVIEGAGSPAEINLADSDFVNLRVAEAARGMAANTAALLVCDIDRGGAFAHLYGTHALLPPAQRALIRGFVLNKFRGDAALLAPGPQMLEAMTGVPTLGVLPMWREHGLPEEDGVFDSWMTAPRPPQAVSAPRGEPEILGRPGDFLAARSGLRVAVVAYPRISNLDEFAPLLRVPGLTLSWARQPQTVHGADLLILPGSKHVAEDLGWLRAQGLDAAVAAHVAAGKPTLAVCGGLQMLGSEVADPHGVEGAATGLGLLPIATEYAADKIQRRSRSRFGALQGFWAALSGVALDGYEIRHGRSVVTDASAPLREAFVDQPGAGWQQGNVLALYTHGLFENAAVMRALFGAATPSLDDTFDGLADFIDRHLGAAVMKGLLAAR